LVLHDIEPSFGRQFFTAFRHQRRLLGLHFASDVHDGVRHRKLEV